MRPRALVYLYQRRLRAHAAQELLAGFGVMIAVALVFAVLVANYSVAGSTAQVVHTVVGPASVQIRARGSEGFSERLLAGVERLPGVKQAAPALEQTGTIVGAGGRTTLDVVGTDVSLAILDGLAHTLPAAVFSQRGVALSEVAARELGISAARVKEAPPVVVSMKIHGQSYPLKVTAVLGHEAAAALSQTSAAVMPLKSLQQLAGLDGRISRILVEAQPGRQAQVRAALDGLSRGRVEVGAADEDVALLRQALHPSNQATTFFAVIAALLGFLFAFNATLLTVPERRQAIADLRIDGAKRTAITQMVFFEALCLGLFASLGGLVIGYLLSHDEFHESTGYLSEAFVLGGGTVIGWQPIVFACVGGLLATILASAIPLLDLRRGRAIDAVYFEDGAPGNALGREARRVCGLTSLVFAIAATVLYLAAPAAAIPATILLALATVLAVPLVLAGMLYAAGVIAARSPRLSILPVALTGLRATTLRALALAATGAVALFGSVALGGSQNDLLRGLDRLARANVAAADVWVLNPGDVMGTATSLPRVDASRVARVPGVARVHVFQGGFIDIGGRRVMVLARPGSTGAELLRTQMVTGTPATATRELQEGGWITVSQQVADEYHLRIGGIVELPTPTGMVPFRLAATTNDFGWPGGAMLVSTSDSHRLWGTRTPTALGVDVAPGANAAHVARAITAALGAGGGVEALTAPQWLDRFDDLASEGLNRLGEISMLLVVAAILALAAALGSAIWQQRTSLSGLRLEGAPPRRLRRIVFMQSALMLSAGCATGVVAGIYGQVVIDGYLQHVTGFPVATVAAGLRPFEIFVVVLAVVLAIAMVPGWSASRASPALALEAE
jgi:putative ABC transport system permease protein